jgi:hypothetical protein
VLAVVTSRVCLPPKNSFEQDTSIPLYFMTASMLSSDAINSILMQTNHENPQLFYIHSSPLNPSINGA